MTDDDPLDHYQEVDLQFEDGRRYRTSFWRDPQKSNLPSWEEPGMVIVHDITTDLVLAAIEDILTQGVVEEAFELIDDQ